MARRISLILGLVLLLLVTLGSFGCAGAYQAPVMPARATFVTQVDAPLDTNVESTEIAGASRGEASAHNVLGVVAWGDASIRNAAEAGGISTVRHADYEFFNLLGLYARFTTVVYGE